MTPRILIIAGSDSGGGAGIQADIKTVTMLGGHAMTAITAITAQNTLGVTAVHPIPTEMVLAQMEAVLSDIGADAVKIGMIGSAETAGAVAGVLEGLDLPIVFDPVMVATSGSALADVTTIAAFTRLASIATVITPNKPELETLSGRLLESESDQFEAVEWFMEATGCRAVLAKGGHWSHPLMSGEAPQGGRLEEQIIDMLYVSDPETGWLEWPINHERLDTRHTHGTGCTLASAIAVDLARGVELCEAVRRATNYLLAALRAAPGIGGGHGPLGHSLGCIPVDYIHRKEA